MAVRTYGDKPISFQIEEGGEYYCIGSEVSSKIRFSISFTFLFGVQFFSIKLNFQLILIHALLVYRSETTCGYVVDLSTKNTRACTGAR